MIDIFTYQNYRTYLQDYYEEQKKSKPYFSYRYFSRRAEMNSSAFLSHLIKGTRNLTPNSIDSTSKAIGHTAEERDFFRSLVLFNQAKTIHEKAQYYEKLAERRGTDSLTLVNSDRYEYYQKWYHCVVRELITLTSFEGNYTKLGKLLKPSISAKEVELSVKLLVRLGFIEIDDNGTYRQIDEVLMATPSGDEIFVIKQFQLAMLDMARQSYDLSNPKECISASTTFCISQETFDLFKLRTRDFRRELQSIAKLDDAPEKVFQFTFNLFPLSGSVNNDDN